MVKAFSSIKEDVFKDKKLAKEAIEEIKTSSSPDALRNALQKLFLQMPGYHGTIDGFEAMLKGNASASGAGTTVPPAKYDSAAKAVTVSVNGTNTVIT